MTTAITQVSAVPAVSDMSITPLCARTLHMHTALWVGGDYVHQGVTDHSLPIRPLQGEVGEGCTVSALSKN